MPPTQPVGETAPAPPRGLGVLLTGGVGHPDRWSRSAEAFAALEAGGCSAIWIADHLYWGSPMPECIVMATVAATATATCRVGTGVLQAPLRRPAVIAKSAATLQQVAGGRFVLGLGSGEHAEEYRRVGADFARRGRLLDAAIDEVRACWETTDEWYAQRPAPSTPIPIWVGGRSDAALARAAERADGWMPIFLTAEGYASARTELARRLDAAADAGAGPRREVVEAPCAIVAVTGPTWSRADALGWMASLWRTPADRFERFLVSGTAADCAEQLAAYRDAGAHEVVALMAHAEPVDPFLEVCARTQIVAA